MIRWRSVIAIAAVGLLAAMPAAPDAALLAQAADGRTHLLIVSGIGGEPSFVDAFHDWGLRLADAAVQRHGLAPEHVTFLAEDADRDPDHVAARSTRDELEAALVAAAGRLAPEDRLILVLFGHGSERDGEARINLPGPDVTAAELDALLDALPTGEIAVVNAASASGAFLPTLSAPGRVVITATRSAAERDATIFGEHFVRAFDGGEADTDRDGRVSLLEAFEFARLEVERAYTGGGQLQTENALLDDDGDGQGARVPDPAAGDGALARHFYLAGTPVVADASPELRELFERKAEVEAAIDALRGRRDAMEAAAYQDALEELLVELALVDQRIREIEEGRS